MTPGQVSHVFVVDPDVTIDPAELARIAPGLQAQLREDFAPEWGAGEEDIVRALDPGDATAAPMKGEVQIQLHKDAPPDEQGALALHFHQDDGTPIIHVFEGLLVQFGVSLSSATSHELLEARADPEGNECVQLPDGRIAAKEICDQVEQLTYQKNGVEVSNFNTRANFMVARDGAKYDFLGKQTDPFQVLDGGYAQVYDPHTGWSQLSGGMHAYRAELNRLGLSRHARRRRRHRHAVATAVIE